MTKNSKLITLFVCAILVELLGLAAMGYGISVAIASEAPFGSIIISIAGVALVMGGFSLGTVVRRR
ncbi:hypothetical protein ES708_23793 [subsurface metagenome]